MMGSHTGMENLLTTHCLDFAQGFNASSPAGGYGGHGGGHTTGDGYGSRQKRPAAPAEDNYSFVSVPLSLFAWKHRGRSLFIVWTGSKHLRDYTPPSCNVRTTCSGTWIKS